MGIFSGSYASPGSDNGFKLAVDQVNASGGINGLQVQYKEFNTDITPQGAATATSLALQYQPDVIIGYSVSAGLKASISQINSAGIPVIQTTLDQLTSPSSLGSQLTFRLELTSAQFAAAADQFLFKTVGVKSMMVVNTQDAAPTDGGNDIVAAAAQAGVKTQRQQVSPTVTDLTEPILAAKSMGAQAIWDWGYPTTDALAIKTAAANGYHGDIMTFSAGTAARDGLIPGSLLTSNIYAVSPTCAPNVLTTPQALKYDAAYQAKFGTAVNDSVTSNWYDAVYLYKQAVEKAGSTEPKAVATALSHVNYQGICGDEQADSNHNLLHGMPIIHFPGGKPALATFVTNVKSPY
jgi:branched-chain amino acid transport system substrate-binding protein